ncbi:DUF2637 domain-containing protein [Amycolatopsis thermophila]|uniref:DUF2637 domain-containing protein n=1 Tax=Amycolatopsis thermophila TaxID=206084 RepID=A0ABU0EMN6_9PSEU|nr:DUF2637 domain-containing protein [Amycolatopsis thermophila]MDQ0376528.1 hypothetical protein [Amycolatopsis thermophila]
MNDIPPATYSWWHRWRLGSIEVTRAKHAADAERKAAQERDRKTKQRDTAAERRARRIRRRDWLVEHRALIATVSAVTVSVAVAIPAQALWFVHVLASGQLGLNPESLIALASPVLIEGLCWLGAFLYADSLGRDTPVRAYRLTTFLFAGIAAAINFAHGCGINPIVGVVFAIASLMGVASWELYMHRTRHIATGMTADEIRLWFKRRVFDRKVYREMQRLRRTFGAQVPLESAWRMGYLRVHGAPTVPVPVPRDLLDWFRKDGSARGSADGSDGSGTGSTPSSEGGSGSGSVAVLDRSKDGSTVEVPVNWDQFRDVDSIIAAHWPELDPANHPDPSLHQDDAKRRHPASGLHVEEPAPASTSGPATSAAPEQEPEPRPLPGLNREERNLGVTGGATAALHRYFDRIASEGHDPDDVNRQELARELGCSARNVGKALAKWAKNRNHA